LSSSSSSSSSFSFSLFQVHLHLTFNRRPLRVHHVPGHGDMAVSRQVSLISSSEARSIFLLADRQGGLCTEVLSGPALFISRRPPMPQAPLPLPSLPPASLPKLPHTFLPVPVAPGAVYCFRKLWGQSGHGVPRHGPLTGCFLRCVHCWTRLCVHYADQRLHSSQVQIARQERKGPECGFGICSANKMGHPGWGRRLFYQKDRGLGMERPSGGFWHSFWHAAKMRGDASVCEVRFLEHLHCLAISVHFLDMCSLYSF
jgi:hypothetical protein